MLKSIHRRKPGHATVVAYLALFIALGGVSWGVATGSIDSREIKNNSVRGKDVRNRSLSGRDIAANRIGGGAVTEATLGTVPRAAAADNADRLGGLTAAQLKLACPGGTTPRVGTCFETTTASTTFDDAVNTCSNRGRRLPTFAELNQFAAGGNVSPAGEWTSSVYEASGELRAVLVNNLGGESFAAVNAPDNRPYRCVVSPTN